MTVWDFPDDKSPSARANPFDTLLFITFSNRVNSAAVLGEIEKGKKKRKRVYSCHVIFLLRLSLLCLCNLLLTFSYSLFSRNELKRKMIFSCYNQYIYIHTYIQNMKFSLTANCQLLGIRWTQEAGFF